MRRARIPYALGEAAVKALSVTSHTLVGVSRAERPQPHGNCFSVLTDADGTERRVLNFNYENLQALGKAGLTWPIAVEPLGDRCVVIMDGRIGERWYDREYCTLKFRRLKFQNYLRHIVFPVPKFESTASPSSLIFSAQEVFDSTHVQSPRQFHPRPLLSQPL